MEQFIQNILVGVRQWVNGKLEDLSFVISSHINSLTEKMTTVETKLDTVEENAQVNKIESIKVNGQIATVTNKAAEVTIPEATQSASGVMSSTDKTKLDGIATGAQVNVIETVKVNNVALAVSDKSVNIAIPDATVTGVKEGDKIISLNDKKLSSTLGIEIYKPAEGQTDAGKTFIRLTGIGGAEVAKVDATDFIKDGMLNSASVHSKKSGTWTPVLPERVTAPEGLADGTYIILVWNTDAGKSATFVNATSLVDLYTAGTGLTLTNNQFTLNAAGTTAATIGGVYVEANSGLTLGSDGKLSITAPTVEQVLTVLDANEATA